VLTVGGDGRELLDFEGAAPAVRPPGEARAGRWRRLASAAARRARG
jgi:hypothetical protein